jgi:hypothetical protein
MDSRAAIRRATSRGSSYARAIEGLLRLFRAADRATSYFDVARPRKSVRALRSSADPIRCSGIFVPGV